MNGIPKKESYSIGEIATICGVEVFQVMDWFRLRKMSYFETKGGHLRVTHSALEIFMTLDGMKLPQEWTQSDWSKFRVLLVEDEEDLREILMELLKDESRIEASCEDNGFDGLLKITSWKPDLILLDFMMPGMNGFEVCKKVRAHPDLKYIPIIALTSLTSHENKSAVYQVGVSDYLSKPFRGETLLERIRVLLGLDHAA